MNISAEELSISLEWLKLAVSEDRKELTHVYFKQTKETLEITAANGYLIFRVTYNHKNNHELEFLLSNPEMHKIMAFLRSLDEESNVEFLSPLSGRYYIGVEGDSDLSIALHPAAQEIKTFRNLRKLLTIPPEAELRLGAICLDKMLINKVVEAFERPLFMFYGESGPVRVVEHNPDEHRPKYIGVIMPIRIIQDRIDSLLT